MSFYRTYRPQTIAEIDNVSVRSQLLTLVKKDKKDLPHAFFFRGPKGAGKTTAARIIAKLFNCETPTKDGPCGVCESCKAIAVGNSIDVLEIDAASNRGIDDVRELRDKIKLSPSSSPYKVYIIDEVHMMTTEAFNALLKTLEEPPAHAVFILATTDPQKVPVTVKSRCMEISFSKAGDEELLQALQRIIEKEHIDIDQDAVEAIAQMADGAFRDAVKLLEQASFIDGKISIESLTSVLSVASPQKRRGFLTTVLVKKDLQEAIACIERLVSEGTDMKSFMTDCLDDLQRALVQKIQGKDLEKEQKIWQETPIREFSKKLVGSFDLLRVSPIPQLPLELAIIDFIQKENMPPSSEPQSTGKPPKSTPTPHDEKKAKPESKVPTKEEMQDTKPPIQVAEVKKQPIVQPADASSEHLNLEKLVSHWPDYIESLKPFNHSVAGVIRSARPKSVEHGVVTIEAFYKFHQERLSEPKVRDILASVLKQLFGVQVRVDVVLGKK